MRHITYVSNLCETYVVLAEIVSSIPLGEWPLTFGSDRDWTTLSDERGVELTTCASNVLDRACLGPASYVQYMHFGWKCKTCNVRQTLISSPVMKLSLNYVLNLYLKFKMSIKSQVRNPGGLVWSSATSWGSRACSRPTRPCGVRKFVYPWFDVPSAWRGFPASGAPA